jgi:hypothetical protein
LTSDSEKEIAAPFTTAASQTIIKKEESLPCNLPSLHSQFGTLIEAAGTLDEPIDLTVDETGSETTMSEPIVAPEGAAARASIIPTPSVGPDTSPDVHANMNADEDNGEGTRADGDLRAEVTSDKRVPARSSSLPKQVAEAQTDRNADGVKVERTDDDYLLRSQNVTRYSNGLGLDHLDIIYHIDTQNSVMFCRLCVWVYILSLFLKAYSQITSRHSSIRHDRDSSSEGRISFPTHTPCRRLIDHCETEHPVESRKFASMTREKLAMIRAQMPDDGM